MHSKAISNPVQENYSHKRVHLTDASFVLTTNTDVARLTMELLSLYDQTKKESGMGWLSLLGGPDTTDKAA